MQRATLEPNLPAEGYPASFVPPPKKAFQWTDILKWGSVQTTPRALANFGGDIVIGASVVQPVDIFGQIGDKCTGFNLLSIVGVVQYSINNGAYRTAPSGNMTLDGAQINSLIIATGPASSCILQLQGV